MKFIYFLLLISTFTSYSQPNRVILKHDTVTYYNILRIDTTSKTITSSSDVFGIKETLYYASNFPFNHFDCEEYYAEDVLFLTDYISIINKKNEEHFLRKYKGRKHIKIGVENATQILPLLTCIRKEYGDDFLIRKQSAVATYFILKSKTRRGVASGIFCEEIINAEEIPVILNFEKLL